jgi:type IV pilus assembly protein PilY1
MKRRNLAVRGAVMGLLIGSLAGPGSGLAQTMDQYYSVPPFVSDQVAPNILLILDNSGSMGGRACDATWCGVHSDVAKSVTPVNQSFVADSTYSGFFDSQTCYIYSGPNTRFEVSTVRVSLSATCSNSNEWDGNLLNWATFRRFDALKKSMSGGDCVTTRNADGTCPATGTPAKITIKAQSTYSSGACCQHHTTAAMPRTAVPPTLVPGSGASSYVGRIPQATAQGGTGSDPADLYIHLRGGINGMGGTFCVDNDNNPPPTNGTVCNRQSDNSNDSDGFVESQFTIRLAVATEPTGVVQQIGAQARFGLFEFKGTAEGARMPPSTPQRR